MIAQIKGQVVGKGTMDVVVDCGGVGYAVLVPLGTLDVVPEIGGSVTLLTILVVREDAFTLYGFATESERGAFKMLTAIQGIGGRIALGILSSTTITEFQRAVLQGNVHALMLLPGIGKKTAERMIVELRDKVAALLPSQHRGVPVSDQASADAVSALQALGFSKLAAEKLVKSALMANPCIQSSEELIRLALRTQS